MWRAEHHLYQAVTDGLGKVELTGLVDDVKAPLPDLALIQDVDGVGRAGHSQSSNSQEASQDLPYTNFGSLRTTGALLRYKGESTLPAPVIPGITQTGVNWKRGETHPAARLLSRCLDSNSAPVQHPSRVRGAIRQMYMNNFLSSEYTCENTSFSYPPRSPGFGSHTDTSSDPLHGLLRSPPWDGSAHCKHHNRYIR